MTESTEHPKWMSAYETDGIPVDGGYVVVDLRAIAKRVGVKGWHWMTKNELIGALNSRLGDV